MRPDAAPDLPDAYGQAQAYAEELRRLYLERRATEAELAEKIVELERAHEQLLAYAYDLAALNERLQSTYRQTLEALARTVDRRDGMTGGHSLRVADYSRVIGARILGGEGRALQVVEYGALLHDIGKIEAYAAVGEGIEMTNAGRLQGEIPLGYHMVRREIEAMPGFPAEVAQAVLHIILSHHGSLEHGSPVVPCTREATLVHMMDNLGGRLGSFDRIEKTLADGEQWSAFDRGISAAAYFAPRQDGLEAA